MADLLLNTITIRQEPDLERKLELAAACGYVGLELWAHEVAPAILGKADRREAAERYGVAAPGEGDRVALTRAAAAAHGLSIAGVCPGSNAAVRWHDSLEPEVLGSLERTMELAAALGARYVLLPVLGAEGTLERTAEHLARLAGPARRHGVALGLEPVGHVGKCSRLDEALSVLDMAAIGGTAGLVLDAFHFFRAGQSLDALAQCPVERVLAVHVNDALDRPIDTLLGHRHRAFPGTGIFDVRGFVAALLGAGYAGDFSVEILNEAYWARDAQGVCREAYDTSRAVLDAAGG